jgi:hypothetical protein
VAEAQTVVPESRIAAIEQILPAGNLVYVADQVGGPSQVRVFGTSGTPQGTIPILPVSAVDQMVRASDGALLFQNTSFVDAPAWYRYDASAKKVARTALYESGAADFSDAEVVREFAISKDGTRIPISIIRRKGTKLDGKNPALLTGYGGFDVSIAPDYSKAAARSWLRHRDREPARRRRVRGSLASCREPDEEAECLRRFSGLRKIFGRPQIHHGRQARNRGRKQRRSVDGRRAHPASGIVRRRNFARGHL